MHPEYFGINPTIPTMHMFMSLSTGSFNLICQYMVRHARKVYVISLAILKLVHVCTNYYDLVELSNILNKDVTFHLINTVGLK